MFKIVVVIKVFVGKKVIIGQYKMKPEGNPTKLGIYSFSISCC